MQAQELRYFRTNVRRLCLKTTQRAVAGQAQISPEYLWRVLAGQSNPSLVVALRIAKAVGKSLNYLVRKPPVLRKNTS